MTGANGGLGLETTRELVRRGATVVMAVRNAEKAERARKEIVAEIPDAILDVRRLDLGSLSSVAEFARGVLGSYPRVDILINNAGVMATAEGQTDDGFETQFGINHLSHFALTARLIPALLASEAARIVTVTSTARLFGQPVDPEDPHLRHSYGPWRAYGQSKLANIHFAIELHRRLDAGNARVASLAAHPGFSNTDLQANSVTASGGGRSQRLSQGAVERFGMSAPNGALPQLRAATDPAASSGRLYAPRYVNFGSPVRRPIFSRSVRPQHLTTLWAVSERETGLTIEI